MEKTKKKIGRPRVEIDWQQFNALCEFQCTLWEISHYFKCSEDTIERACQREHKLPFAEYFDLHSVKGKISLRRKVFQMAMAGHFPALKLCLANYLGMTEDPVVPEQEEEYSPPSFMSAAARSDEEFG